MRSLPAIARDIQQQWPCIEARAIGRGVKPGARPPKTLPRVRLLGSSIKVEKGVKRAVLTAVLYLPPAHEAYTAAASLTQTTCPWSTAECRAACLVDSGMLSMTPAYNARHWKETLRKGNPKLFHELLAWEIAAHERAAKRQGKRAAIRLDGTSDLGMARRYAPMFPGVQFYDYTKSLARALRAQGLYPNWHVTFSFSGRNRADSRRVLAWGGNVAVVFQARPPLAAGHRRPAFAGDPLPATWEGFPVLNGDETDVRFDDPTGHVVGLSLKGMAKWADRVATAGIFAEPVTAHRGRRLAVV